jgi:hypothetical protein
VELVDDAYEILLGRMPGESPSAPPAAHCKEMNMNYIAYGVLLTGNFDAAAPAPELVQKALRLVRFLTIQDGIPANNVLGHREVGAMAGFDWRKGQFKSCPGKLFDMSAFRGML